MQNTVPARMDSDATVAQRVASRTLAERSEAYANEVRRLIAAGFTVMRRTGTIDPRVSDIVREAGLSNQAFYRHFTGKDELLLAILDEGQRQLVEYLEHRVARAAPGADQVRAWIEGVMEQARNTQAAGRTRPFAIDSPRLADRFPQEIARSRELLLRALRPAVAEAGGDPRRDSDAIYHLVMGRMQDALVARERPSHEDVEHLVRFALAGFRGAT